MPPTKPRTYDPKLVVLTVAGTPIGGYADGTMITVNRESDAFTKYVGTQGVVSRAKSNDKSGSVTIFLAQTSPSNDVLSAIAKDDELSNNGVVPVVVKDIGGTSEHFGTFAWIRKVPESEYAREINAREWVLDASSLDQNVGSNLPPVL